MLGFYLVLFLKAHVKRLVPTFLKTAVKVSIEYANALGHLKPILGFSNILMFLNG